MSKCTHCKLRIGTNRVKHCTIDGDGYHHSFNGQPAVVFVSGTKHWHKNGLHHRANGPAIIYHTRQKHWIINGTRHRLDGPAIIYPDGTKRWYVRDTEWTEEEFNKNFKKERRESKQAKQNKDSKNIPYPKIGLCILAIGVLVGLWRSF